MYNTSGFLNRILSRPSKSWTSEDNESGEILALGDLREDMSLRSLVGRNDHDRLAHGSRGGGLNGITSVGWDLSVRRMYILEWYGDEMIYAVAQMS